jgi:hypothetical protein
MVLEETRKAKSEEIWVFIAINTIQKHFNFQTKMEHREGARIRKVTGLQA